VPRLKTETKLRRDAEKAAKKRVKEGTLKSSEVDGYIRGYLRTPASSSSSK
jgi:hypothetical protein